MCDDDLTLNQAIKRLESKRNAIHERLKRNLEIEPIDDRGALVGPCNPCSGSCFDMDRMQESLKDSDRAVRIPNGLTAEEMMEFILSYADREIEQQAHAPIPKSLHDRIQALRNKADQLKE